MNIAPGITWIFNWLISLFRKTGSNLDPSLSVPTVATCFGYEDPGDDGHGAFGDYNNNTTTAGVSIPIPILEATTGYSASKVHSFTVTVEIADITVSGLRITDAGPGETVNGQHGLIWDKKLNIGHILDLTYGACQQLGVKYDANNASYVAKYWIVDSKGNAVQIKGLDAPKHYV